MKFVLAFAFILITTVSFADNKPALGENASPEYKDCLAEDKCPSQMCPNSCAMMNKSNYNGNKGSDNKNNGKPLPHSGTKQ